MEGINLNNLITYKHASLRYFNKNERHITRICEDDVLILVFEGVLRFSENGICYEVYPGEYHIQRANLFQEGYAASDSPKYLYIHFQGAWDEHNTLPFRGRFDYEKLKDKMIEMDTLAHGEYSYTERCGKFYEILTLLNNRTEKKTTANKIAMFIESESLKDISLEMICKKFNFSKNHIINIFKKEYGVTPVKYINDVKIRNAKYLLEVTSDTTESIALESGFNDYSHFYKLFLRESGISPTEWRKQKQIRPEKAM